jgi:hypothetical protein
MEPTMEAGVEPAGEARPPLGPVVKIDEGRIREHLDEVVRSTVEETLNALLDAEADQLCGARKYERTEGRKDTRAGSYDRHLQTKAGEVTLTVPKLRNLPFETAIIERYRRRESSVEEALIEMYLAGVSVRRVEDITQALWGTRVSASTVSDLKQKIYGKIDEWRAYKRDWESCMTLNDNWGYAHADHNWKGVGTVVSNLVKCSMYGGNYLLDVGPTPEGHLPDECLKRLHEVGEWMRRYGKSIYGSRRSAVGYSSFGQFTQHGNTVYAHVDEWIGTEMVLAGIKARLQSVRFEQDGSRIVLKDLLPEPPYTPGPVIALEFDS